MVETPLDPPRNAVAALRPYFAPALRYVGWFAFFLLLAPVIGPRGYGLFMLALSGIAIIEALLAAPVAQALVNLAVVEERHWSTALVTMIVTGAGASGALYALSNTLGMMMGEAAIGDMFRSLAILPVLGALTVVPMAALRRQGRDGPVIAASAAGLAAGGGIALSMAWAGAGPWSLVAQIVVQRLVECTALWGMLGERIGIVWSRRRFNDLVGALDWRALAVAWPAVSRLALCLVTGLILGPTAAGLVMLAARPAKAVADIFLAGTAERSPSAIVGRACRVVFPALLASALLPVALLPIVDLRWWGAVLPAQILLLGGIPAAVIFARTVCAQGRPAEPLWPLMQAVGGIVVVALAAPSGLVTIAMASVGWAAVIALVSLWPIRRTLGAGWRAALADAVRPCGGAVIAGLIAFLLAGPIGSALDPVPALCLLSAACWLAYLVIRGEPATAERPIAPLTAAAMQPGSGANSGL